MKEKIEKERQYSKFFFFFYYSFFGLTLSSCAEKGKNSCRGMQSASCGKRPTQKSQSACFYFSETGKKPAKMAQQ